MHIKNRKIVNITKDRKNYNQYIIPGPIDAHIHIESSMLMPSEFSRLAITQGIVGDVADLHEIADVL